MAFHEFKGWERHLVDVRVKHPVVAPLGIEVINGVEVDWGKAPEGATHVAIVRGRFIGWRKCTPEMLCNWVVNAWEVSEADPHRWLDINKHCIFEHPDVRGVARPLIENPLPEGREWPENATHFSPHYCGFFINEGRNTYLHDGPGWKKFTGKGQLDYWLKDPETVSRYVNKPEQPKPAPKKQVGWW